MSRNMPRKARGGRNRGYAQNMQRNKNNQYQRNNPKCYNCGDSHYSNQCEEHDEFKMFTRNGKKLYRGTLTKEEMKIITNYRENKKAEKKQAKEDKQLLKRKQLELTHKMYEKMLEIDNNNAQKKKIKKRRSTSPKGSPKVDSKRRSKSVSDTEPNLILNEMQKLNSQFATMKSRIDKMESQGNRGVYELNVSTDVDGSEDLSDSVQDQNSSEDYSDLLDSSDETINYTGIAKEIITNITKSKKKDNRNVGHIKGSITKACNRYNLNVVQRAKLVQELANQIGIDIDNTDSIDDVRSKIADYYL